MFDPYASALTQAASGSPKAFPLAFAAGMMTSMGPCVAPRFIAASSFAAHGSRTKALAGVACFVGGLVGGYAALGGAAALVMRTARVSSFVYAAVAAALALWALRTLWKSAQESDRCSSIRTPRAGAAFTLGASFAFVASPCCTPLVAAVAAYGSAMGDPRYASALLATFALGHALPLLGAAAGIGSVGHALRRYGAGSAMDVVGASIGLFLAGYYAVLA